MERMLKRFVDACDAGRLCVGPFVSFSPHKKNKSRLLSGQRPAILYQRNISDVPRSRVATQLISRST